MAKIFSTGPLENENNNTTLTTELWVKVLNNDEDDETNVTIRVFSLNGTKVEVGEAQLEIGPESSDFATFDVENEVEFEAQIQLEDEKDDVLISVFGKNANGDLVAAHRVLHSELIRIDELTD